MPTPSWIRATNLGSKALTIKLVYPSREKKPRPPIVLTLRPGERSMPFLDEAAEDNQLWQRLVRDKVVRIERVVFTPAFVSINNPSTEIVRIPIRALDKSKTADKPSQIVVEPKHTTGPVAVGALTAPPSKVAARFGVNIENNWRIGPPTTPRAVGTYASEDVYICYECGGPIVFRYRPPRPIHIARFF